MIDSHTHIMDQAFEGEREDMIAAFESDGIEAIVECATATDDIEAVYRLGEAHARVFTALGIHPHSASEYSPEVEANIRALAASEKVVAIGEIGLDYHYDYNPRDLQKKVLREQIELALALDLPVILHSRESSADMLGILSEYPGVRGVMHCFSGSVETMREVIKRGLHIGIGGTVTFKNAKKAAEVARQVPLDRLLIETDCPYLAPVPKRGQRNCPAYVKYVAEAVARIRGALASEIEAATADNARRLFRVEV